MSDDDRLGGWGSGVGAWEARGWPAAHFLRYSGCKFHMRIPLSARASSSHIHIYVQSNGGKGRWLARSNESLLPTNTRIQASLPWEEEGKRR